MGAEHYQLVLQRGVGAGQVGEHADLEEKVWKLVYAGRRERSRVMQTLARRRAW